nr:MAG TPA: helix-turn-helix domain protein [Caudoviricetes sp.]
MTLKEFREVEELTVQEVADLLFISKSMYEKLELNDRKPSIATLKKIKQLYKAYNRPFNVDIFL